MSVYVPASAVNLFRLGYQVTKASQNLPQSATSTLYTVTGGNVMVTAMYGLITTVCGATATSVSLGTVPTTGTASSTGLATATAVTSLEAGTWLTLSQSGSKATGLIAGTNAGTTLFQTAVNFVVAPGTISWTTGANDTGQVKWYLWYLPLDTGATVS